MKQKRRPTNRKWIVLCEDDALVEYKALRDEILKRQGIENQTILGIITVFGVILGIALAQHVPLLFLFAYPPIAFIAACQWADRYYIVRLAGAYIRNGVEKKSKNIGWENVLKKRRYPLYRYVAYGTFVGTQLFAIIIYGLFMFTKIANNPPPAFSAEVRDIIKNQKLYDIDGKIKDATEKDMTMYIFGCVITICFSFLTYMVIWDTRKKSKKVEVELETG